MEFSLTSNSFNIYTLKDSEIKLHYNKNDKHSINSFNSITSIEQNYNALKKSRGEKNVLPFKFTKIDCSDENNKEVCVNKTSLPQITFNNRYNQEFKIIGDVPKNKITKFIKNKNKLIKENKDYPFLCILYFDTSTEVSNEFMNIWGHITDQFENISIIKLGGINCNNNNYCLNFESIPHIQLKIKKTNEEINYTGDLKFNDIMKFIASYLDNPDYL